MCLGSAHSGGAGSTEWDRKGESQPQIQHPSLPPALWENEEFVAIFKLKCIVVVMSEASGHLPSLSERLHQVNERGEC